jgi:DNA-binding NtrC family response regulator
MEVMMPGYRADTAADRQPVNTATPFGLSAIDRACVRLLVGHALAVVEREFILETLRHYSGNRTRAAGLLRISIRSLRDRIRAYRGQGESVPESRSSLSGCRAARGPADVRH